MLAEWGSLFVASFVLVTALVVVALAVGAVAVAIWLVREHVRTRRAAPVDWYGLSLPPVPARHNFSAPGENARQRVQHGPGAWSGKQPVEEEMYTQEELPF